VIVRYDPGKAYGFVKSDKHDEDIFFLKAEMPPEIAPCQKREEVEHQRVEFEIKTMPDGKLRAQRMELLPDQLEGPEGEEDEQPDVSLPPLDEELVNEMTDFIAQAGGGCDYGWFSSRFAKVKKKQLEGHFDIVPTDRGTQRIELPEDHPARRERSGSRAEEVEDENEPPPDDPAIALGPGCQPLGVIRSYDVAKGFGFIHSEGMEEDVFFPRTALPDAFHSKRKSELPELIGVHVSFELNPSSERGPRADRLTLLLQWHASDRCWLLKRR